MPENREEPWGPHDAKNAAIASLVYMGATKLGQKYFFDPLLLQENPLYWASIEHVALPLMYGFVLGFAAESFSKRDKPFLAHAGPGLLVAISTLVVGVYVLSGLSFEVGNMIGAASAGVGVHLGGKTRYKIGQNW